MSYKEYKKGDQVIYRVDEPFEKTKEYKGTVTEVHEDHITVDVPEISSHLWIDKDTDYMITRGE